MSTKYVCSECGSDKIWQDAWVNPNDLTDVRTFDQHFCDECCSEVGTDEAQEDGPYCACDAAQQPCNKAWHQAEGGNN